MIEQSGSIGLDLTGAKRVSVTGMYFDENGKTDGSAAILVNAATVSVCGNHIHRSGEGAASGAVTSQIKFSGTVNNFSSCGNVYEPATPTSDTCGGTGQPPCWPQYVYDADAGTTLTSAGFYESPGPQLLGVLSPAAAAIVSIAQVLPARRSFLTGLVLSNDTGSINSVIDIAPGAATDSSGIFVIQNTNVCKVDLTKSGLGGLDTGSFTTSTTYFYFVVADTNNPGGATTPNCIASEAPTPNLTGVGYSAPGYRLVGALYTTSSTPANLILFHQNAGTFYLTFPGEDINVANLGNADTAYVLASVPNGIAVEWLGRCVSSAKVIVYNSNQNPGTPASFPTVPGYDVTSTSQTAEKYRAWTDAARHIHARASGGTTTFQCVTDGWEMDRSQ